MKMNAWAFLVSRNQSIDYKTIVAPNFIDAARLRSLLTKATEGDLTPPDQANIRWIQGSAAGDFSIVFRVVKAKAADIGEARGEFLKDAFGRDIYLVEGLIFQEDPNFLRKNITSSHLDQAHVQIKAHYQRFWYSDEIAISDCFPLQEGTFSQILTLEELEPIAVTPKSKRPGKSSKAVVLARSLSKEPMRFGSNFLPILATTAVVFILFSLLIGEWLSGVDITGHTKVSEGCAYITQLQRTSNSKPQEWLKILEDMEKQNKSAAFFVSTVTPDQATATQTVQMETVPTFQEKDGTIQMKFHPLQQAIMQLRSNRNSKFVNNTILEVRMIKPATNQKAQCLQSLQTF